MLSKIFANEAAPLTAQDLGARFSAAASAGVSANPAPTVDFGLDR